MTLIFAWLCSALAADSTSLDVVTLNTWGLPAPISEHRTSRFSDIRGWLDRESADVVGLQEVWRGARSLLDAFPGLLLPERHRDCGLGLVTRHPTESGVTRHTYVAERGLDAWKAKGAILATVKMDGQPLQVVVTHLQSGGSVKSAQVRAAQVAELLPLLTPGQPAIVMGDFNLYNDIGLDRETSATLVEAGLLDAALEAGVEDPTYPGWPDRYDRIYLRDGDTASIRPREVRVIGYDDDPNTPAPMRFSDHLPVWARLDLVRSDSEAVLADGWP